MSSINITWKDPNTYKNDPTKKANIESTVKKSAISTGAEKRGAAKAEIRGGEHKSKPPGDQKNHVTVDYKKTNGDHVTTKHVPT